MTEVSQQVKDEMRESAFKEKLYSDKSEVQIAKALVEIAWQLDELNNHRIIQY